MIFKTVVNKEELTGVYITETDQMALAGMDMKNSGYLLHFLQILIEMLNQPFRQG